MTLWADRFNQHALWASIAEARSRINRLTLSTANAEDLSVLEYVGQVIELLERRRSDSDPHEIVPRMLDTTNNAVAAWIPSLDAVLDGTWTMGQALQTTDDVLETLAAWPPMKPARYLSGIQASTEAFSGKVQEALDEISHLTDQTKTELVSLEESETKLAAAIKVESVRITDAIKSFEEDSKHSVAELIASATSDLQQNASLQEKSSAKLLELLKTHERNARDTVHATTALAVATDYGKYARNKSISAWVNDIVAAFIGLVGVAAIVYHLIFNSQGNSDVIGVSFTRFAVSVAALGLAALIGRRASQHHREARAAKRTELALRRVGPFTAALPKEEQQEIILELTERVFIRGDLDAASSVPDKSFKDRIAALRAKRQTEPEPGG